MFAVHKEYGVGIVVSKLDGWNRVKFASRPYPVLVKTSKAYLALPRYVKVT